MFDGRGDTGGNAPLKPRRADARPAAAAGRSASPRVAELTARLAAEIAAHDLTRRALVESRGMLDSVIDSISEAVFIKDLESRYIVFNAAAERMFNVRSEDVLGRRSDALFGPESARHLIAVDLELIRTREPITYEVTGATVDASRVYLTTKAPFYDAGGEMTGIIGISQDITERKQTELAFARQAAQLAMAQKIARVGSWEQDLITGAVWRSDEVYRTLEARPQDVDATLSGFLRFIAPGDLPRVQAALARTLETGAPYSEEYWLRTARGGARYVQSMAEIVRDPEGRPHRMIGTIHDMTERKLAEDALRRREAQLAEAQRIARFGSWEWEVASGAIQWSAETYRMFGVVPGEFSPSLTAYWDFVHPDDVEEVKQLTAASLAGADDFELDYRIVPRNGEIRTVHSQGALRRAPDGTPLVMTGTIHDITERKRTEDALRRSEARLAQAQDIARVGSWERDLATPLQVVSEGMCRICGLDPAAGPYRFGHVRALIPPEDLARLDAAVAALIAGGAPLDIECRFRRPDGAARIMHSFAEVLRGPDGAPLALVGTSQDVTEQRRYERELADSHREMRQLYHHLQEVQEEERGRIAREVHDEFGAVLTALHLAVHRLTNLADAACKETAEILAQMRGMLAIASESLDDVVEGLQPQMLTYLGIVATVEWYCGKFAERTGIRCRCVLPGNENEIEVEPPVAVALFRCLQESLTNVVKHAQARRVDIGLVTPGDTILLTIADDGCGLRPSGDRRGHGFGIRGMIERVARLGGEVVIASGPLGGTEVRINLPRNNTNKDSG